MQDYKNPAAVALGRMGKGKPKTVSDADRERRRVQMIKLNSGRAKKIAAARVSKESLEVAIEARAKAGVFTPVQIGE